MLEIDGLLRLAVTDEQAEEEAEDEVEEETEDSPASGFLRARSEILEKANILESEEGDGVEGREKLKAARRDGSYKRDEEERGKKERQESWREEKRVILFQLLLYPLISD